jgi:TFIIF-interacting CTD phosphatase-like protein
MSQEFQRIEQNVSVPYLPSNCTGKRYTLVLDLDETLIHFNEERQRHLNTVCV